METRLTRLGGELIIHSQPGNGTRLSSYLPISQVPGVV
jgi:signal transduction histidine kinase